MGIHSKKLRKTVFLSAILVQLLSCGTGKGVSNRSKGTVGPYLPTQSNGPQLEEQN